MAVTQAVELAPATRAQRERTAFLLDDYVDNGARILELGPGDGWLGAYLLHSGFLGYRRFDAAPPADFVGEIRHWRELGLAPESFDLVFAFDLRRPVDFLAECLDLLVPGGYLFLIAPLPQRDRGGRWRAILGRGRAARGDETPGFDEQDLHGFRLIDRRRVRGVEQWVKLRKPL